MSNDDEQTPSEISMMAAYEISEEAVAESPADEPEIDRAAIRRSRKAAAKEAKRLVRDKYNAILQARPPGSQPANKILGLAVALYQDGPIGRRDLTSARARLEAAIRSDLPDHTLLRAPRPISARPAQMGLMIYETRAITVDGQQFVSAENHTVLLGDTSIVFVSGLLPGGTRPHLFERVYERGDGPAMLAEIQLHLSALWPTLMWMRAEQRRGGRGEPINVMMTPFQDGLLFGSLVKVDVPPAGPTVSVIGPGRQQTRTLWDYYGDGQGQRLWAMTNTFVDQGLLSPGQTQLRDMLSAFVRDYADVVKDNDWRWRIGLGLDDPAVATVAKVFRLKSPQQDRRAAALAALEAIVRSRPWHLEATRTHASQEERRLRHEAEA
jgi:hypothetical protein